MSTTHPVASPPFADTTWAPPPRRCRAVALALTFALVAPLAVARAQDVPDSGGPPSADELWAVIQDLRREVSGLRSQVDDLTSELAAARGGDRGPEDEPDGFYIPRLAADFQDSGLPASLGGTYTKPYLAEVGSRTYLGGYIDLEFREPRGSENREFDQHRFVPFLYSDVSDRVKVAAELELEHGHEVEVEYAQMDYLFDEAFNFRAGIMLLPLGKLNEVHDSPIQDLTDRPLVDRYIIPTTLRDAGVGAFGEVSEEVGYQLAITNGFRGLASDGTNVITSEDGLRDAAPQSDDGIGEPYENLNDKLAYSGRVHWSPVLGTEFGASALFDTYDEDANNDLRIYALDATVDGKAVSWLPDPLELLGEYAKADIDRDTFAKDSGVAGDMDGYYAQANWHFGDEWLASWRERGLVEDGSRFTFVTRYDYIDLDDYTRRRTTLGLNFRPNADKTVFKLDYQFNDDSGAHAGDHDDDAVLFSVATYF